MKAEGRHVLKHICTPAEITDVMIDSRSIPFIYFQPKCLPSFTLFISLTTNCSYISVD